MLLEGCDAEVEEDFVKILYSTMGVTKSGKQLEHTVIDGKDGHIKGTTTEIEDDDVLLILLVKAIGNGSNLEHFKNTEDREVLSSEKKFGFCKLIVLVF